MNQDIEVTLGFTNQVASDSDLSISTWDISTNTIPTGGKSGKVYKIVELSTRTTLTDNATPPALLPSNGLAFVINDNPTSTADFEFVYIIR